MTDRKRQLRALGHKADLTMFGVAYLLNVNPRTLRRWVDSRYPDRAPPQNAIDLLQRYVDGDVPVTWADWISHGVDPAEWRPARADGLIGIEAGIYLRENLGEDALAK